MNIKVKFFLFFIVGAVIGALVSISVYFSIGALAQRELVKVNSVLTNTFSDLKLEKEINKKLNDALKIQTLALENVKLLFEEKEQQKELTIKQLEAKAIKTENLLSQLKTTYEDNLAQVSLESTELKKRLYEADKLYEERYKLIKKINDLNERILKNNYRSELSQKACLEFKKGKSWNWVSEEDCKSFDKLKLENGVMIDEFNVLSSQLDNINRQLFSFKRVEKKQEKTLN